MHLIVNRSVTVTRRELLTPDSILSLLRWVGHKCQLFRVMNKSCGCVAADRKDSWWCWFSTEHWCEPTAAATTEFHCW